MIPNHITLVSVHSAYRRYTNNNTVYLVAATSKPTPTAEKLNHETRTIIDQCMKDHPELEAILTSPLPESEPIDVLKSGNVELKKLTCGVQGAREDFAVREKAKLAAVERASSVMSHATT